MTGANDRTGVGSGRGDWRTPPELFEQLDRVFRFDYDAFASPENALCDTYSTMGGSYYEGTEMRPRDGLALRWTARRVFLNPPYSRGFLAGAVKKAASERNNAEIIVALLPDARDTGWWREWVRPYATDYPIGRVHFIHPDGPCGSAKCSSRHKFGEPCRDTPGGSVVAVYLPDWLNGGPREAHPH